jgi:hypothetical protein
MAVGVIGNHDRWPDIPWPLVGLAVIIVLMLIHRD